MTAPANSNGRPKRINGRTTYNELLDAAVSIWSEEGVDGVTMQAVAERASKTRGTVYHHFADREALLEAARSHFDDRFVKLFSPANFEAGNPYSLIAGIAADSPELFRAYMRDILDRDPLTDPLLRYGRDFCRWMGNEGWLLPDADPDHVALVTISMWLAATLAVSLGKTAAERREQAEKFALTFEHVFNRAFLKPEYHQTASSLQAANPKTKATRRPRTM